MESTSYSQFILGMQPFPTQPARLLCYPAECRQMGREPQGREQGKARTEI